MEDKQVGELWELCHADRDSNTMYVSGKMIELIRKLVEERRAVYKSQHSCADSHLSDALRDFGIDPETWNVRLAF